MNKIITIKQILDTYLMKYNKELRKIENFSDINKELKYIKNSYIELGKYSDLIWINNRYSNYYFLNSLWKKQRDKYAFLYSLSKYIEYLDYFENIWLNEEYLYYLEFNFDENFFTDNNIVILPNIHYYFWKENNWKIWSIEWNSTCKFHNYNIDLKNYFDKILIEIGLDKYLDVIYYSWDFGCWEEYLLKIDFNFDIWKYKKRIINYIK